MTTNTQKFTGKVLSLYQSVHTRVKTLTNTPSAKMFGTFALAMLALTLIVGYCSAAYTPAYTPVPFGCVTAQIPDQVAIVGDIFTMMLNVVVSNWLTMMMIVVSIMLVAWGAITGLFRRGKRRGR